MPLINTATARDIESVLVANNSQLELDHTNEPTELARQYLENYEAGVDEACGKLAELMRFGQDEGIKLKATQSVLNIHGVNEKNQKVGAPNIVVVVNSKDPDANAFLKGAVKNTVVDI